MSLSFMVVDFSTLSMSSMNFPSDLVKSLKTKPKSLNMFKHFKHYTIYKIMHYTVQTKKVSKPNFKPISTSSNNERIISNFFHYSIVLYFSLKASKLTINRNKNHFS